MNSKRLIALTGAALMGFASLAQAEAPSSDVQAEMAALKARIAELESKQGQSWLNERRAEEVKALVREVLADADTRASLMQDGMVAGHNGSRFFLASQDGGFLLNVGGQIQFRYTWNNRDSSFADNNESGFELRRVKLFFDGHIANPRIKYSIGLQTHDDQTIFLDHAKVGYQLTDTLSLWGGEDKAPFLREEIIDSSHQLAVDRSLVNELFTAGRVQGVWVTWDPNEMIKVAGSINDGARSGEATPNPGLFGTNSTKAFDDDETDFGATARVDFKLAGNWAQMSDFSSWSGEELAIFVGAALHYQLGETGDGQTSSLFTDSFYAYTVDASVESNGFSLYGAVVGVIFDDGVGAVSGSFESYGFLGQVAYNFNDKIEPFIRYEHINLDTPALLVGQHKIEMWTVGVNYYLAKHAAKFTADLLWITDPVVVPSTGLGILPDAIGDDEQFVLRGQFQLLF